MKNKLIFIVVLLIAFLFPINVKALDYGFNEYYLSNYSIYINVNENNTFDVTERIDATFNVNKHGIIRKIPLTNRVARVDGTVNNNRAAVKNIAVNEPFTTYNEDGYKNIKIGDPNYTFTGDKEYVITYTYDIGNDQSKNYDEFYFDIIGNEWTTYINNITFSITMPKEFDQSKIGFSTGEYGLVGSNNVKYIVEGNTISGEYIGTLGAFQSLTIRLELPEGYFVNDDIDLTLATYFGMPILFALISFFLWFKYGRDERVIETVEFYPPKGLNSAEVGYMYKGQADNAGVVSLLVYLADKGYLKIEEYCPYPDVPSYESFKIIRLKDYDGNNKNEKEFFDGLFLRRRGWFGNMSNKDKGKLIDEVTVGGLRNQFNSVVNKIKFDLNFGPSDNPIFEKSTVWKSLIVALMIIVTIVASVLIPTFEYASGSETTITVIIMISWIPVCIVSLAKPLHKSWRLLCAFITFGTALAIFDEQPIASALANDSILAYGFLVNWICIIIMFLSYEYMSKRTKYGNEMLGKIRGFKTFLKMAEKPKLEELVLQNPTYFYDILPYTYALGVSKKWIEKFESITLTAPDWYSGSDTFNVDSFGTFISNTMSSATAVSDSGSYDGGSYSGGGGSDGGGGFSGGGSGGGGGSSW